MMTSTGLRLGCYMPTLLDANLLTSVVSLLLSCPRRWIISFVVIVKIQSPWTREPMCAEKRVSMQM